MADIDEGALAVLPRAGIIRDDGGSYADWINELADRAAAQVEQAPVIAEIRNGEDYRYCKATLAAYRKVKREAEDGRKSITSQLDAAKKAVMGFVAEQIAPVNEGIEVMSALQREYEDAARAEKRARLEAWWERTYPALALCTGEAAEPLVPFDRVFDPDWVKRVGELGRDDKARDAMSAIADGIAAGQAEIDAAGLAPEVRALALSRLFATLEPGGCIAWAVEEDRRRRDLERVQAATAPTGAAVCAETPETPQTASEPPSAGRVSVTLDLPCEPRSDRVLCVWVKDAEEIERARGAMVAAGLHGCIGRVM